MSAQSTDRESGTTFPLLGGILYGSIAFILSAIGSIAYLLAEGADTGRELQNVFQLEAGSSPDILLQALGWLFYNTHRVPLQITGRDGSQISINLVEELGISNPLTHYLLPALILGVFGLILAQRAGAHNARSGLQAGAALVLGYGVLAIAGAVFSKVSLQGVTYQPALLHAVAIAGIGYPVISGGLGGVIKGVLA